MTTTAEPLTILDPEMVEELQPPCEAETLHCDDAAEWIVRGLCDKCGATIDLFCTKHKDRLASGGTQKLWFHTDDCAGNIRLTAYEPL